MEVASETPVDKDGVQDGHPGALAPVAAHDEDIYGSSIASECSSSSSVYRHPFSSFKFGPSPPSPPRSAPKPSSTSANSIPAGSALSERLHAMSFSPKQGYPGMAQSGTSSPMTVPPSPSTTYAESQHSMDEYEPDSPSSLSSWNSFMSGHRGDLADVEDLELGEPELETVSELDEENVAGSLVALGDTHTSHHSYSPHNESEDDSHHPGSRPRRPLSMPHPGAADGLRFGESLNRRRTLTQQHYVHGHGHHNSPAFSHFSPRAGGHGLSHHSRWTSRTPSSLAARRQKGRIAELAEEGAGEPHGINTTNLSAAVAAQDRGSTSSPALASPLGTGATLPPPPVVRCEAAYNANMFACPPPPPQFRPVSPSETVPAVPSPLCECISAENTGNAATTEQDATGGAPRVGDDQETRATSCVSDRSTAAASLPHGLAAPTPHRPTLDPTQRGTTSSFASPPASSPSTSPSAATTATVASSASSLEAGFEYAGRRRVSPSSPDTTPPSSPLQPTSVSLSRKDSARSRRSTSPPRPHRHKAPLRPCFSRRNSSQNTTSASTSEPGDSSPRGRCHVHFSSAPPQTIRTHSPVDYDRSSCPVSNRLSVQDVEEMHSLQMEMGLLSAKCSAIAAITSCKLPAAPNRASTEPALSRDPLDATSALLAPPTDGDQVDGRPRRDSTGALTHHLGGGWPSSNKNRLSPAEHLRMQREKERERACRMAGIGIGLGGRNLGRGVGAQSTNPLIARFGLNTPPPPLPGTSNPFAARGTTQVEAPTQPSPSVPDGPEGIRPSPTYTNGGLPPGREAAPTSERVPRATSLHRTASEDRALRRSLVCMESDADEPRETSANSLVSDEQDGRGRQTTRSTAKAVPALVHTSPSPSPPPTARASSYPDVSDEAQSPLKTPQPLSHPHPHTTQGVRGYFDQSSRPATGSRSSYPTATRSSYPTSRCGYDSPSSAYESGSEYDLIG
ncbi:unnamed protein product [Parajaminaea phylloscopi]